jgi:GNAT superfamily N-acetyltransferase
MNVNAAIGILATNGKNLISKFILQLNSEERNNFMRNGTNKKEWIKRWLRNKHNYDNERIANRIAKYNARTTFNKYVNSLSKLKNANMSVRRFMIAVEKGGPYASLSIGKKGYIQLEPACLNNFNRGVYIHYGETNKKYRGQKIGFRLRKTAVNAARNAGIPLWQVSQNLEKLVKAGNLPVSGKIMTKLGATQINYAPPCRATNKRGAYNYAFVVGLPTRAAMKPPRVVTVPRRPRSRMRPRTAH